MGEPLFGGIKLTFADLFAALSISNSVASVCREILGKIDSDDYDGHGLPLPKELMKSSYFPSWHSVAENRNPHGARLTRVGEVPFIRLTTKGESQ